MMVVFKFNPPLEQRLPETHTLLLHDGLTVRDADCMGLFKTQKGFDGFVPGFLLDVRKMYPLMTIWRRQRSEA